MSSFPPSPDGGVILHLGLGAFHRAHQAVYLQQLIELGDTRWSISAGNIRPDPSGVLDALRAQQGVYILETISPAADHRYQRIAALREVLPYDPSLAGLIERGADPATRIVSFTVTEAGYYLGPDHHLDPSHPDLASDLRGNTRLTLYAALAALLQARMLRGSGPLTLLNCDNLRHNGDRVRAGLLEFLELRGLHTLRNWVKTHTTCPNAMVDRITPRPASEVRERVRAATGIDDAAALMAEDFIQWVIEDRFCNGRPAWEAVGVQMVDSVSPYEEAKIRILNAAHSAIAWAGTLAGHRYIHEGTHDPRIRQLAHDYITDDVLPCLHSPEHPSPIDLAGYRDTVLDRFGNPAIRDTNQRVAMDGFSKIPGFVAPTVRERLAQGASIRAVARLPALFLAFLQMWHRGELPYAYHDQGMDPAVAHAICDSADPVAALCADPGLWGSAAGHPGLTATVRRACEDVRIFSGVPLA